MKSVVLNASISWAMRVSIKILCDGLIWELGLTSTFSMVVGQLSPEAEFRLIKAYRLHTAMQLCRKCTLEQNSSNSGYYII